MDAGAGASLLVQRARARPWGLATAALVGDLTEVRLDEGDDALDEASLFQIGSVTKTMTGVLLADAILRQETTAAATLGEVLGLEGGAAGVTLGQLATQRSGLPRLPPNLDPSSVDQSDPYAAYTEDGLRQALAEVELGPGEHLYSNFGFMTLGLALAAVTGSPLAQLFRERIFEPLGMTSAGCPPAEQGRVTGYSGPAPTPWWTTQLPGAGGVGASIGDLCLYLRAHVDPPAGALGEAIELATTIHAQAPGPMGYGWAHQGGGCWHNGGTGGFRSFVAFHRPSRTAVALLANSAQAEMIDGVGFATLTEIIRANGAV